LFVRKAQATHARAAINLTSIYFKFGLLKHYRPTESNGILFNLVLLAGILKEVTTPPITGCDLVTLAGRGKNTPKPTVMTEFWIPDRNALSPYFMHISRRNEYMKNIHINNFGMRH
jgi:hypothetical protein